MTKSSSSWSAKDSVIVLSFLVLFGCAVLLCVALRCLVLSYVVLSWVVLPVVILSSVVLRRVFSACLELSSRLHHNQRSDRRHSWVLRSPRCQYGKLSSSQSDKAHTRHRQTGQRQRQIQWQRQIQQQIQRQLQRQRQIQMQLQDNKKDTDTDTKAQTKTNRQMLRQIQGNRTEVIAHIHLGRYCISWYINLTSLWSTV